MHPFLKIANADYNNFYDISGYTQQDISLKFSHCGCYFQQPKQCIAIGHNNNLAYQ